MSAEDDGFPLASDTPEPETEVDTGASGPSAYGGADVSNGALIAILVVVCLIAVVGISTATLFYVAKKREWTVRETLRRSARKVVTAFTPRSRTEFPRELKDDVPPTPRIRQEDLEKGLDQARVKNLEESRRKHGWAI